MEYEKIPYPSFCWSLGTTSYRTRRFNESIERQLALLEEFRSQPGGQGWGKEQQAAYYRFLQAQGFLSGDASIPEKDARLKTSGLVMLGLLDSARELTGAGRALLAICRSGDYTPDNELELARDSYLYMKQLLKAAVTVRGQVVRPYVVVLWLLSRLGYLTREEFTCLAPLCISREAALRVERDIHAVRARRMTIDQALMNPLWQLESYRRAWTLWHNHEPDEALLRAISFNRKSAGRYGAGYLRLYQALRRVWVQGERAAIPTLLEATYQVEQGVRWREWLFTTPARRSVQKAPEAALRPEFLRPCAEEHLKNCFFLRLHTLKARATLEDYMDLNRRYIQASDTVRFAGRIELDVLPRHFFGPLGEQLLSIAFTPSEHLGEDCPLETIAPFLHFDPAQVYAGVSRQFGYPVATAPQARAALAAERTRRLHALLDTRFTRSALAGLLPLFAARDDQQLQGQITDNADVPTLFEYVVALAWYHLSGRQGDILSYMRLTLDADLLPRSHAAGGGADIVYGYPAAPGGAYPAHTLLLEATLNERTNQRVAEMEPVSRHLGNYLLEHPGQEAYALLVAPQLHLNLIADFRVRRRCPYFSTDGARAIPGMKLLVLGTRELGQALEGGWDYAALYQLFDEAYRLPADTPDQVRRWYGEAIADKL